MNQNPSQHSTHTGSQLRAEAGKEKDALVDDTRTMLAATAHMVEEGVAGARQRLSAALDGGAKIYHRIEDKAVEGAKITDKALHDHPYPALAIALGVGVLLGYLASNHPSRSSHWF